MLSVCLVYHYTKDYYCDIQMKIIIVIIQISLLTTVNQISLLIQVRFNNNSPELHITWNTKLAAALHVKRY